MNNISYIKKHGFRKCDPFSISSDYHHVNSGFGEVFETKNCYIEDGELIIEDDNLIEVVMLKGYKTIKRNHQDSNSFQLVPSRGWNHFKYKSCFNDDLYITINKSVCGMMLTDKTFSFIKHKLFNIGNIEEGLFESDLQKLIGNVRFREYTINSILKNK